MKKFYLTTLALLISLNAFANGNGQVGSVGTQDPQTIEELNERISELTRAQQNTSDPVLMQQITEEILRLSRQLIAFLPPPSPAAYVPPEPKKLTVTADKVLVVPDEILIMDTYSKIRLTALDNDIVFSRGIRIIGLDQDRIGFDIYRLKKGEVRELDLTRDVYSKYSHRWELQTSMYIHKLQFEITSAKLFGNRGKLQIELIQ